MRRSQPLDALGEFDVPPGRTVVRVTGGEEDLQGVTAEHKPCVAPEFVRYSRDMHQWDGGGRVRQPALGLLWPCSTRS